jgi:hypothetical protein
MINYSLSLTGPNPNMELEMANKAFTDFVESLPKELREIPEVFHAPYGFKLVEIEGEKLWQPGTLEEWRAAVAEVRGVNPMTIPDPPPKSCYNSSPTKCNNGPCPDRYFCGGLVNQVTGYVFCQCTYG